MARTALTVNTLPRNGAALTTEPADPVNGNSVVCNSYLLMSFFSTSGGTVTIKSPSFVDGDSTDGLKTPDRVFTLPVAAVFLWVCPSGLYNQPVDNLVYLDFGQATSVAVYRF